MNREILREIENNINEMTKSQKKIADYIINNSVQCAFQTADQLANSVGTSTPTVVRFANLFSYSGYAEFQKDLQENIKDMIALYSKLGSSSKGFNAKNHIVDEVVQIQLNNFNNTLENINEELILKASSLISEADRVYISGSRSCFSVAHYLNYNLNRILGNCDQIISIGGDLAEKVDRIKKGDVVILMSLPKYVKNIVSVAKVANERGAKVISITDSYMSPLVKHSDVLFRVEIKSYDFHNSIMTSMLIAEILISVIVRQNPDKIKEQLLKSEDLLREFDVHFDK